MKEGTYNSEAELLGRALGGSEVAAGASTLNATGDRADEALAVAEAVVVGGAARAEVGVEKTARGAVCRRGQSVRT